MQAIQVSLDAGRKRYLIIIPGARRGGVSGPGDPVTTALHVTFHGPRASEGAGARGAADYVGDPARTAHRLLFPFCTQGRPGQGNGVQDCKHRSSEADERSAIRDLSPAPAEIRLRATAEAARGYHAA